MGEVEETNYRPGNGLTRRVQGVGEGLEGVTLPSPFAAEMTEAEADALVNNHRALYQQALKRRETIASSVAKTKCVHTLSGVPVPQKKSRAAKSGGQKGKRRRKAGATTGSQADLPAPASTEEELVTDGLPDLPLPASSQQQQQTELDEGLDEEQDEEQEEDDEEDSEDEAGAEQHQQQLAQQQQQLGVEQNGAVRGTRSEAVNAHWARQNRALQAQVEDLKATVDILQISQVEAQQKLAAANSECEILRSRLGELEAQQAGGVSEMSSDGPIVNPANLTRDNNGNVILKTSLEKKEFAVKALDTFTWLITDAPVECMEFFPTFEVFQPHLITKYQLCGVNRDEYFYATGGRIEFEKLVMKVIKTKRSNTHKKVRFYAWGAGGLVDESKWPLLAVEQIIPSKKRTEEKWLEEFRHGIPFANIAFEKAALAAFSVVTSSMVYVKIPMVAYLCVVVEAPLESYRPGNGQPSLGGVPQTNSNLVRAKTTVVVAALHAAMVNNPTFLKHDEPKGLVLGSGKVRILIEGWERVFL
ncbi:unnamed protein product [Closterium sp. NIES-65]|nr:unnamed protein product [Closterium sp. NIES-65]CAI5973414.1 unnamed protein product [Closterium sp. NIES-65]